MFYDILHGINELSAPIAMALELAILLGFDGQLKQDSDMEIELFQSVIEQLKGNLKVAGKEQALVWLYVKTWNVYGEHVLDYGDLWNFTDKDMEAALVTMAYPKAEDKKVFEKIKKFSCFGPKQEDKEVEELKEIIMDRFNNDAIEYYKWSLKISKVAISEIKQRNEGLKRKTDTRYLKKQLKKKKDRRRWNSSPAVVVTSSTESSLTDS